MHIQMKRVYDDPSPGDGTRVLIDRLWPRGLSKTRARIDVWAKNLAPSTELRKWYNHERARRSAFRRKYWKELEDRRDEIDKFLSSIDKRKRLTLLTATKDVEDSEVPVLCRFLMKR